MKGNENGQDKANASSSKINIYCIYASANASNEISDYNILRGGKTILQTAQTGI